jgi:hypothetical protein
MVALTNLKLPAPGRRQHPATIEHNMLVAAMGIEPPTIDEAPIFVSVEDSMFINMSLGGGNIAQWTGGWDRSHKPDDLCQGTEKTPSQHSPANAASTASPSAQHHCYLRPSLMQPPQQESIA